MKAFIPYGNEMIATKHIESIERKEDIGTNYDQSQWTSYRYEYHYVLLHMTSGKTHTFTFNTKADADDFIKEYLT